MWKTHKQWNNNDNPAFAIELKRRWKMNLIVVQTTVSDLSTISKILENFPIKIITDIYEGFRYNEHNRL